MYFLILKSSISGIPKKNFKVIDFSQTPKFTIGKYPKKIILFELSLIL